MEYRKHLPERPFRAIQNCTKKVEGRVPDSSNNEYQQMKPGDTILFEHLETGEVLPVRIIFIHHYPDFRSMLEVEGTGKVLSSRGNIEQGVESYNSIPNYQENVVKYGVYAIGINPLTGEQKSLNSPTTHSIN